MCNPILGGDKDCWTFSMILLKHSTRHYDGVQLKTFLKVSISILVCGINSSLL